MNFPKNMKYILTEEEKLKIKKAVEDAEKKTSGEIVPYLVKESDFYLSSIFKSALFFNVFSLIFVYIFYKFQLLSDFLKFEYILLIPLVITILGGWLGYIPFVRRLLAGKKELEYRVRMKALEAFVEKEVFRTKNRTGVLIFISFLERIVYVLGDSGINQKVKHKDWVEIVQVVIDGIKKNQIADGIINAIHKTGELLQKSGLAIEKDDINELSDEIVEK